MEKEKKDLPIEKAATSALAEAVEMSSPSSPSSSQRSEKLRNLVAFWALGLINNFGYVVMIAGAEEIASGGIGFVYLADIVPCLMVKLTGPYWLHSFSYGQRTVALTILMLASLWCVAFGEGSESLQLFGVVFASLQSGMGEASFLALTSFYHSQACLSAWSSGTGFSGVAGYLWVEFFHYNMGLSFSWTLLLASVVPLFFGVAYFKVLEEPWIERYRSASMEFGHVPPSVNEDTKQKDSLECQALIVHKDDVPYTGRLSFSERLKVILSIWPYMLPLIIVYFSEYAMQSGTWTAIGFPATNDASRKKFYLYAGFAYQAGVCVSRSSGSIFQANRTILYIMPLLQFGLLIFFFLVATYHFWYDWTLLLPCFWVGLLGGAVYVNAFKLLAKEVDPHLREIALGAASVGDSFGIVLADIFGLCIQGCLYSLNNIPGASFSISCR